MRQTYHVELNKRVHKRESNINLVYYIENKRFFKQVVKKDFVLIEMFVVPLRCTNKLVSLILILI